MRRSLGEILRRGLALSGGCGGVRSLAVRALLAAVLVLPPMGAASIAHAEDAPPPAAATAATDAPAPAADAAAATEGDKAAAPAPAGPTEVQVGAYILRISNVSQKDGTFNVDMWVWLRWKGDLRPDKTFEVADGSITSRSDTEVLEDEGYHYTSVRVQALVYHDFDVRHFPMDDHTLDIDIEDSTYDDSTIRYVADRGMALDPGLQVAGWGVSLLQPRATEHVYPTDYGLRSTGSATSVYSRLTIPIALKRESMMALVKQFWISGLAVVLALLALLIHSHDLDARFGLGVGSIFAASANAFVLADNLPKTTSLTLAEQLNLLSVAVIFLSVFVSIWSLRLRYAGRAEDSVKLDRIALIGLAVFYVIANVAIIRVSLG
ncbi:ligand-gated ion channel [Ancylobacter lacus]|uniref:hypothetical protein n=1 Tax=Ancylobacter lacus TaxID=2579970 RepID=UPI001BD197D2|nr:hypothetical protein [Ancylobacter lacus]MBS7540862.1 hypothetical protein [Ancylobacter lacus]